MTVMQLLIKLPGALVFVLVPHQTGLFRACLGVGERRGLVVDGYVLPGALKNKDYKHPVECYSKQKDFVYILFTEIKMQVGKVSFNNFQRFRETFKLQKLDGKMQMCIVQPKVMRTKMATTGVNYWMCNFSMKPHVSLLVCPSEFLNGREITLLTLLSQHLFCETSRPFSKL